MLKRNFALLIIGAVVLGVGALAWARGAPERPSQAPGGVAAHQGRGPGRGGAGILGGAVHGDLVVPNRDAAGFGNVSFDRGKVTDASATSITVMRADGQSATKAIDSATRVRGVQSADQLKTGSDAIVVSRGDRAVFVGQRQGDRPDRPDGPDKQGRNGPKAAEPDVP